MTIVKGTQFQISSATNSRVRIANLTATTAIVVYANITTGDVKARHLTLSGGTITAGAEATVDTGVVNFNGHVPITRLTDTSALVVYTSSTASKARVLTVSGTTITVNAVRNLTDTGVTSVDLDTLTSTSVIYVYSTSVINGQARILSISGTTITENAAFTYQSGNCRTSQVVALTSTTAIAFWKNPSSSWRPTGEVLDISGTTITGNTSYELSTVNGDTITSGNAIRMDGGLLDSTHILISYKDAFGNAITLVVTESAKVLSGGATLNLGSVQTETHVAALTGSLAIIISSLVSSNIRIDEVSISGTTVTLEDSTTVSPPGFCDVKALDNENAIAVWIGSVEAISITVSSTDLSLAAMTKPADIDAAGAFIYLALLEGGTPILTKISTALSADGTTVFSPGAGDNIGVECGRFNSDVVWVAGNFDGTNVIEKSEDGGSTFTVKDDATIGNVRAFVMGPDSDDKILLFDETNSSILETKDDGNTWTSINASVTPEVNAIARLGKNVEESVFGNDGAANNSINYSVNSGDDLEDYQTGVYPNANATRVIVN